MTPTMKLRFVERAEATRLDGEIHFVRKIRVLQQWWVDEYAAESGTLEPRGEWHDVPLEVEE